jgi:DNA uptake protein ComE-like DNA-binding protein
MKLRGAYHLGLIVLGLVAAGPVAADRPREPAPPRTAAEHRADHTPVDLNTADLETLVAIPAIGPDLAHQIIAIRPFATTADLNRLQNVTTERLELIRTVTTVIPPTEIVQEKLGNAPAKRSASGSAKAKVDLNHANFETLAAVPEIGPELARAIIAARPFTAVDDLNRLNSISPEQLELIRAAVFITPPAKPVRNDAKAAKKPARQR